MAPIAVAIPPRLMMFAFTPIPRMTMNEIRMPSGSVARPEQVAREGRQRSE
ncbi:MAG: hypothetical protein IH965_15090 [Gemmatimonadetes bacterium]|nr:hypothetical protein [Gemmatimonadota bacterium]